MRAVMWLEALRGSRPGGRVTAAVLAVAAAAYAALLAVRIADPKPGSAVLVLLCLPIALLAVSFGRWAGLAAAAAGAAVVVLWDVTGGDPGGPTGYVSRIVAFVTIGYGLGWFADRLLVVLRAQQAEAARLDRARQELEEAQQLGRLGSWTWDAATDRLEWSPQMYEIFAIDRPANPLTFLEVVAARSHPDDASAPVAARERALRDHRPFEFPQRLLLPGGGLRHVLNRGEVILGPDGTVTGLRGTTQDVTGFEEARQAAQAAADRMTVVLDTMLDAVSVGTAVRDATGRIVDFDITYANGASRHVYGLPVADIIGHRWSEVFPERLRGDILARFTHMVETGEPIELVDYPYHRTSPAGHELHIVDLRAAKLGDGYVAAWRDATARVQAAREREAAAARFSVAFEHAPAGMLLLDRDGVIVRANPVVTTITGRTHDELLTTRLADATDRRDRAALAEELSRLAAGDLALVRREVRLLAADRTRRWVALRATRIHEAGSDDTPEVVVVHLEDVSDRKAYEGRLQYLADHDPLTGLFNRRRFHEELSHQVAVDVRQHQQSTVALVDLDNFKYINDTLGHAAGDRLIQATARSLRSRLRDSDVIGRLGGDEFAVLLPGTDAAAATVLAETLLAAVAESTTTHDGRTIRSTASVGLAATTGTTGSDADDVLANADLAMYAAKDAGRNTYVAFQPDSAYAARSLARYQWLDRIRDALEHDLFTLHAQPILDLRTGTVTGAELLLRMRDDGELVPPDQFLDIAERHGLAPAIDRFVITHGIALAAAQGVSPIFRWEINLSADSLGEPDIPELIDTELLRTSLPPSSLVFEITETAAITNMDSARAFAGRVGDLGCRFALDDFGAGYGSFYYLKHLPFDYLKIDGEFIRQLTSSPTDQVVVDAIVTAARRLGKETIAEYVGDEPTLELLRRLHVDHAQGYHVGRPMDPAQALLPRQRPSGTTSEPSRRTTGA